MFNSSVGMYPTVFQSIDEKAKPTAKKSTGIMLYGKMAEDLWETSLPHTLLCNLSSIPLTLFPLLFSVRHVEGRDVKMTADFVKTAFGKICLCNKLKVTLLSDKASLSQFPTVQLAMNAQIHDGHLKGWKSKAQA
jgi:hypothetical protein